MSKMAKTWFWVLSPHLQKRGIFLVGHGLNLRPEVCREICESLGELGYDCLILALQGHGSSFSEFKQVSFRHWLNDFSLAYDEAQRRRRDIDCEELLFFGFSTSAIVALNFVKGVLEADSSQRPFHKIILLAPALKLRPYWMVVKKILQWIPGQWWLPSMNRSGYLAHRGTPKQAYLALFEGMQALGDPFSLKIPVLCLLESKDELIDSQGLYRQWQMSCQTQPFNFWHLDLFPECEAPVFIHHLCIDSKSAGVVRWAFLMSQISAFLDSSLS